MNKAVQKSVSIRGVQFKYGISDDSRSTFEQIGKKLFGTDIILVLLDIGDIRGKTVMQKQVFLAWKLLDKHAVDLAYAPHYYGAYSQIVNDNINYLSGKGLLKIIKTNKDGVVYTLTARGRESIDKIRKKMRDLGVDMAKLEEKKADWDEWDKEGILRYTYRNYPEYTTETKLARFKWPSQ